ncbi:hypothetical protein F4814DRAFT_378848 [Daldinia grandis]|nr:hypothetical protein F4814DRAFT_378848 [Daldinia grandis]
MFVLCLVIWFAGTRLDKFSSILQVSCEPFLNLEERLLKRQALQNSQATFMQLVKFHPHLMKADCEDGVWKKKMLVVHFV